SPASSRTPVMPSRFSAWYLTKDSCQAPASKLLARFRPVDTLDHGGRGTVLVAVRGFAGQQTGQSTDVVLPCGIMGHAADQLDEKRAAGFGNEMLDAGAQRLEISFGQFDESEPP